LPPLAPVVVVVMLPLAVVIVPLVEEMLPLPVVIVPLVVDRLCVVKAIASLTLMVEPGALPTRLVVLVVAKVAVPALLMFQPAVPTTSLSAAPVVLNVNPFCVPVALFEMPPLTISELLLPLLLTVTAVPGLPALPKELPWAVVIIVPLAEIEAGAAMMIPVAVAPTLMPVGHGSITIAVPAAAPVSFKPPRPVAEPFINSPYEPAGTFVTVMTAVPPVVVEPSIVIVPPAVKGFALSNLMFGAESKPATT